MFRLLNTNNFHFPQRECNKMTFRFIFLPINTWTFSLSALLLFNVGSFTRSSTIKRLRRVAEPSSCFRSVSAGNTEEIKHSINSTQTQNFLWAIHIWFNFQAPTPSSFYLHSVHEFQRLHAPSTGHACNRQGLEPISSPSHCFPPFRGGGESQDLFLVCSPAPHEAEQEDHSPHPLHIPGTESSVKTKKKFNLNQPCCREYLTHFKNE